MFEHIEEPRAISGVKLAGDPAGLAAILDEDCAAAIWHRVPPPELARWIETLEPERLPKARVIVAPKDVREVALQICEMCETPDCEERMMLINDITALSEMFVGLTRARYLRLRLDVVTTNACRKFHVDAVTSRLICTYRGQGTQYGTGREGADPYPVETTPTGSPIITRGTLWPETPRSGLLHRSPPIEGTGETRLLLVIDPVKALENDD